jgi:predicted acylesterase/phospholipase RssA
MFRHLVISGGGPTLLPVLSAIQHLESKQIIQLDQIQSIDATSAGSIVAILISLRFSWDVIYDYVIKRPWHELFHVRLSMILDTYKNKGLYSLHTIRQLFKPLMASKDLDVDTMTMQNLFDITHIDNHFYSFDVNQFSTVNISHTTHPSLPLMVAVQMTCGIPVLIAPVCWNHGCFIDGGLRCNYPLNECIKRPGVELAQILGFRNQYIDIQPLHITEESTLFDFMFGIMFKIMFPPCPSESLTPLIRNEVIISTENLSISYLWSAISSASVRQQLYAHGESCAIQFLHEHEAN